MYRGTSSLPRFEIRAIALLPDLTKHIVGVGCRQRLARVEYPEPRSLRRGDVPRTGRKVI